MIFLIVILLVLSFILITPFKVRVEYRSDVQEDEYQYEDGEGKYSPYTQTELTDIEKYLPAEV